MQEHNKVTVNYNSRATRENGRWYLEVSTSFDEWKRLPGWAVTREEIEARADWFQGSAERALENALEALMDSYEPAWDYNAPPPQVEREPELHETGERVSFGSWQDTTESTGIDVNAEMEALLKQVSNIHIDADGVTERTLPAWKYDADGNLIGGGDMDDILF